MDSMRPEHDKSHDAELMITAAHIVILSLIAWAAVALMGACS